MTRVKVKKADKHKVLSREAIEHSIRQCMDKEGDVYDKAVVLLMALAKGHHFDSGNRRTAFAATLGFLELNNHVCNTSHDDDVMRGIREGFYAKDEIKTWLMGHGIKPFHRRRKVR